MKSSFLQYDPHVLRSLKKSTVRTTTLFYLYEIYPNASYPAEIARNTGIDASNVIGALRGMGDRYNGSSSLVEMGLVDVIEMEGVKYYRLSEYGKKTVEFLKMYVKNTGYNKVYLR